MLFVIGNIQTFAHLLYQVTQHLVDIDVKVRFCASMSTGGLIQGTGSLSTLCNANCDYDLSKFCVIISSWMKLLTSCAIVPAASNVHVAMC